MATIPLIAHELDMARLERIIKRLIIIIILLVGIIGFGAYEWCQYDYTDVVIDSQGGGNANYLKAGMNGVINNAESGGQGKN